MTGEPPESKPPEPKKTSLDPAGGNLRFTGTAGFEPLDADSDGLFDVLVVEPEFLTSVDAEFGFRGELLKGGEHISSMRTWRTAIPIRHAYSGQPGTHTTRLWFSGEEIYRSAKDGPYQVLLYASSAIGHEDSVRIRTPAYSCADFGELDVTIESISDLGVDLDADGLFDVLRVTIELSVRAEGECVVAVDLSTGIRGSTFNSKTIRLTPGTHEIEMDFGGQAISVNRKDGPWEITVNLTDPEYGWLDSRSYQTRPYTADDFGPPPIMLTGIFDDQAVDRDGNGLFDALRFTFGADVNAESAAAYDVTAWLGDSTGLGSAFVTGGGTRMLTPGIQPISINFDGSAIANRRQDGRFTVTAILIQNEKRKEVAFFEPNYLTKRYRYWDFSPWPPRFAYLDTLHSRLEDTDGDGLADYLVITPLMRSTAAAHLMVSATLTDKHGRFIHEGTGATDIGREEKAFIDIRFDGRHIFGSLEDGPYIIDHAHFYTHESVWSGLDVPLGETEPYRYDRFEPAAVIVGVVEASPDSAAVRAEVRTTHSVDWTDSTGRYHLVFVDSDLDSLLVRTSHKTAHRWDIYLNGVYLKTGDAVWMPIEVGRIDTLDFLAPRPR